MVVKLRKNMKFSLLLIVSGALLSTGCRKKEDKKVAHTPANGTQTAQNSGWDNASSAGDSWGEGYGNAQGGQQPQAAGQDDWYAGAQGQQQAAAQGGQDQWGNSSASLGASQGGQGQWQGGSQPAPRGQQTASAGGYGGGGGDTYGSNYGSSAYGSYGASGGAKAEPGYAPSDSEVAALGSDSGYASDPAAVGGGGGDSYTVQKGDTLTKIAKQHGTTVKTLMSINGMKSMKEASRLQIGMKLRVP